MQENTQDIELNQDTILDGICSILNAYNKHGIILGAKTRITSDIDIDSVGVMDVIMEIEDKFNIDIPVNLLSDIETVGDLVEIVLLKSRKN